MLAEVTGKINEYYFRIEIIDDMEMIFLKVGNEDETILHFEYGTWYIMPTGETMLFAAIIFHKAMTLPKTNMN